MIGKNRQSLFLVLATILVLTLTVLPSTAEASPYTRVTVDEKAVEYDVPIVEKDEQVYVPLRHTLETFGFRVEWYGDWQTINMVKDKTRVVVRIDSSKAWLISRHATLEFSPYIFDNRTMVKPEFIAQITGAKLEYDQDTRTIAFTTK